MKKFYYLIFAISLIGIFAISSCKKEPKTNDVVPTGVVKGRVLAANGTTGIGAVSVFVNFKGELYYTQTNSNGYFSLNAPVGKQTIHFQSGKGNMFRSQLEITVIEKGEVNIPNGTIKLNQVANLAYIPGAFDKIETIIIDSLNYTATQLSVSDLSNYANISNYTAIFLNCGKSGNLDSTMYANLYQFVLNGGSIYASDWAVEYLTGDGNNKNQNHDRRNHICNHDAHNKTCTPKIGGFIHDSLLCTQKQGSSGIVTGAQILSVDIQTFLNKTSIDVEYDLGAWEVIKVLGNIWEVMVVDNTQNYGPLAIRTTLSSNNKNLQTSNWTTICYTPTGSTASVTVTIPNSQLSAYLANGATLGSCTGNAGTILFTTFHNHPYGHVDPDVQKILEYFILNL